LARDLLLAPLLGKGSAVVCSVSGAASTATGPVGRAKARTTVAAVGDGGLADTHPEGSGALSCRGSCGFIEPLSNGGE
jgi:hypothetical protein